MNCVVYILGVVHRSTILYLEYTFRRQNEQISRTISQNYDFRVSRIFAIVNRAGGVRVKQPIFDENTISASKDHLFIFN